MDDDPFETVAIAYSQPQAAVLMSLFQWHGIPAYAQNIEMVRANSPLTLALGGIPIRVHREAAVDARELLADADRRSRTAGRTVGGPPCNQRSWCIGRFSVRGGRAATARQRGGDRR
jgi:hypothetical protein